MNEEVELVYLSEFARRLGKSEKAVRTTVGRDLKRAPADKTYPVALKVGPHWAFRRSDVDAFFARQAGA
jgi:hypothetical protein